MLRLLVGPYLWHARIVMSQLSIFGVGREKWELQSGGHPRLEEDSSRQVQSWMVFVAQGGLAL